MLPSCAQADTLSARSGCRMCLVSHRSAGVKGAGRMAVGLVCELALAGAGGAIQRRVMSRYGDLHSCVSVLVHWPTRPADSVFICCDPAVSAWAAGGTCESREPRLPNLFRDCR
jgi:AhpD family alkylhydroperoxidase